MESQWPRAVGSRAPAPQRQDRRRASLASTGEGACAHVVFAGDGARATKGWTKTLRGAADCAAAPLGLYPPPGTSPNLPGRSLRAAGCTAKRARPRAASSATVAGIMAGLLPF